MQVLAFEGLFEIHNFQDFKKGISIGSTLDLEKALKSII